MSNLKKCCICKNDLDITLFNKNKRKKDRLQPACKECNKKSSAKHYKNNKKSYMEARTIRRNKLLQFVFDYLKEHPCVDCQEKDPIVLDFDHLFDKESNISSMIHEARPLDRIKKEIIKCEVRCANCHRRKTAKQFNWYKNIAT